MAAREQSHRPRPRLRALNPAHWPVRWRLAFASAGLTLLILLLFAVVIGRLAADRVRDDFDRELRSAVGILSDQMRVIDTPQGPFVQGPFLDDFVLPNGASVRVFGPDGQLLDASKGAEYLGPPQPGIYDLGPIRVATAQIVDSSSGDVLGFVQYARSEENIDSTIQRLWLLIAAGVLGGTLLASLAGLAIANRAIRPIASLTAAAREIATTRDPSKRMPEPLAEDEVGELARTLEQMLRALDAVRAEREGAMQRQREFVADASHEMRTPLTSILANLELLQASLADTPQDEDREMVESALRSSKRMSRLVADLLLLARADAGRISERRPCDLAEIAGAAAAEVAPLGAGHRLSVDNGRPIPVKGNPDELHRMVLNLLDNAVRHTPPGSSIELRLREDPGAEIAVVEVSDDGPGIAPGQEEEIFGRFVRGLGPSDTAGGGGTGLGLAIARAVANSHGGRVEAGTSEMGGALFRVSLPLSHSREQTPADTPT
jgi:two-component system, OmpR family, sensor kinase